MKRRKNWIIFIIIVLAVVLSSNTVTRDKYQEMYFYPHSVAVNAVNEKILSGYRVLSVTNSDVPTYEGIYVLFEKEH